MKSVQAEIATLATVRARNSSQIRTLHLLDIENLIGDPHPELTAVPEALVEYRRRIGIGGGDLAVLATNGYLAFATKSAWPGALVRIGRGPDGADLALLEEAHVDWVARRFGRVVLGSGDGIFADLVAELRMLGVEVVIAARPGTIARSLKQQARIVPMLPEVA